MVTARSQITRLVVGADLTVGGWSRRRARGRRTSPYEPSSVLDSVTPPAGSVSADGTASVVSQSLAPGAGGSVGRRVVPDRRAAGTRYSSAAHAAHGEPLDSESLSRALP